MRIKLTENYFIEQCIHAPFSWDLFKVSEGVRNGVTVTVEKPIAFGFSLEHLIKKIGDYELSESNETVDFEEYLRRYKEISESVKESIIKQLKTLNYGIRS